MTLNTCTKTLYKFKILKFLTINKKFFLSFLILLLHVNLHAVTNITVDLNGDTTLTQTELDVWHDTAFTAQEALAQPTEWGPGGSYECLGAPDPGLADGSTHSTLTSAGGTFGDPNWNQNFSMEFTTYDRSQDPETTPFAGTVATEFTPADNVDFTYFDQVTQSGAESVGWGIDFSLDDSATDYETALLDFTNGGAPGTALVYGASLSLVDIESSAANPARVVVYGTDGVTILSQSLIGVVNPSNGASNHLYINSDVAIGYIGIVNGSGSLGSRIGLGDFKAFGVPEPSSAMLLLISASCLVFFNRKRN